ncbi:hypothetical protein ACFY2M_42350 [Streptomyces sp. NPDC001276]|uniref:hypothetical protein n=1 Tax=Streptomyces sp. NPDC001276 TaxID=3364555 RepID=UPI0036BBB4C3
MAVLSFTALALLSLHVVGMTAADSTLGSTARAAVGGFLAAATLGLLLTGLARANRRSSDGRS